MRRIYIILSILIFVFGVTACATKFERWVDNKSMQRPPSLNEHIVQSNDTLYAIAWLYGISYIQLAEWNGISKPDYLIYPGQRINLKKPKVASNTKQKSMRAAQSDKTKEKERKIPIISDSRWVWPIPKVSQPVPYRGGIKIKGKPNQEVRATLDGVVVYSGFGLKHYDGLVIIKHKGDIFSAYGFVDRITVKKGMKVLTNEVIAYLPSESKNMNLYFDMRYRNKRLNPLKYLPKAI